MRNISVNHEYRNQQKKIDFKIKQLKYECDTWKRQLCFMLEENVWLKTRLSEILKDRIDNNLLDQIEHFQSRFIREDDVIGLLRNEIANLNKLLVAREMFEDGIIMKKVNRKIKNLRHNITATERDFSNLKSEFNSYILENI
ncbi:MAG TPA: hypothetical protein VJ765_03250 [Chitinophagaceae bacterium]|nr:hypothetical protein [Chitinophagaceae bacterium]